jgi:hypothetical protein
MNDNDLLALPKGTEVDVLGVNPDQPVRRALWVSLQYDDQEHWAVVDDPENPGAWYGVEPWRIALPE